MSNHNKKAVLDMIEAAKDSERRNSSSDVPRVEGWRTVGEILATIPELDWLWHGTLNWRACEEDIRRCRCSCTAVAVSYGLVLPTDGSQRAAAVKGFFIENLDAFGWDTVQELFEKHQEEWRAA